MKFVILSLTTLISLSAFAQSKMGPEAVEMFNVMKHPQVIDCMTRENIDTPNPEKTVISIKGKSVPGTFRGFIQTYTCDIEN